MENTYLTALHGMEELLPDWDNPMGSFNKKLYTEMFKRYYESKLEVYDALETGYNNAIDKEQYILNMACAVTDKAASEVEAITKKNKKEAKLVDFNLCIVVYVLPAILKYGGKSAQPLTEEILRQWKERFPATNLSAAPFEEIEAGFHKKWCYITTAVCETFGKPDDCYELNLLRNYRDGYLMQQPDGEEIIREYYDVAPTIVHRINRMEDKNEVYRNLWDTYLKPCISMIENGENEPCRELYVQMVEDLREKYFYSRGQ